RRLCGAMVCDPFTGFLSASDDSTMDRHPRSQTAVLYCFAATACKRNQEGSVANHPAPRVLWQFLQASRKMPLTRLGTPIRASLAFCRDSAPVPSPAAPDTEAFFDSE